MTVTSTGRYNKGKDIQAKEGTMPTDTLQELGDNVQLHSAEPIMERKSDLYGLVRVYPPAAPPVEWADHSWLLTTDKAPDEGEPLSVRLKAEHIMECFERPHFISSHHIFGVEALT